MNILLLQLHRIKIILPSSLLIFRSCNPDICSIEEASSVQEIKIGSLWPLNVFLIVIPSRHHSLIVALGLLVMVL